MAAIDLESPLSATLTDSLNRLRQLNTQDIQINWKQHSNDTTVKDIFADATKTSDCFAESWPIAELNDRQHIAWERGLQILWLYQEFQIPADFNGYPLSGMILRLALTWWANDAQIYVDEQLVQSGDLFECFTRICLSPHVTSGQVFRVAIRLVSPGHDDGALVRSQLIYELPAHHPTPEPSFIADELTVLATLEPDSQPHIEQAISQLNWTSLKAASGPNQDTSPDAALDLWDSLTTSSDIIPATVHPFQQSLSQLRRDLQPYSLKLKARKIECVGHAHLDMAWLWPVADTWKAAERTFKSILQLQQEFPELTYTHSSPALFEWIEQNRPDLFKQIQQKVADGSWSIDAGLWIEPDFNVISGEAIARQILYGQQYCLEKFGKISTIAWLPDSFGFCWQLPQLLTQGGIETFATLKLSWNDTTEFPHRLFWWESPDGTRILSLMLPPIGTDIDPTKMAHHAAKWESSTTFTNTLWLPGLGDHGGGPTRDMLQKARRWKASPFFPQISFTTAQKYIEELPIAPVPSHPENKRNRSHRSEKNSKSLPIWKDELYLELHRGCYTTHADQKQQNRRCEDLLYQAEIFATIAYLTANQPYPKADIDTAWKKLLFNQFHDILPGTSIPEVFIEANREWVHVQQIGSRVLEESLDAIARQIPLPVPPHPDAQPIIVFNSLSWSRNSVITVSVPETSSKVLSSQWEIYSSSQQLIPCQKDAQKQDTGQQVSFLAKNIPAVGYQCFWICLSDRPAPQQTSKENAPNHYTLENEFIQATLDANTGQITSLIEKATHTETFSAPGNQLQVFQDRGQYWDAWNIDPDYENHPLAKPTLDSIRWVENGPIKQHVNTIHKFQKSTISQHYSLEAGIPYLKIETHINWQESQVLLKTHFPLTVSSDIATYEIPFGAITRTTTPTTAAQKAQWEVPALTWADLSQTEQGQTFGISILTDCKHGFDAGPNHLRLTLLKSPIWPDPKSDQGHHRFTYAIYPHSDTWQSARTVHHARELNIKPTIYRPIDPLEVIKKATQPARSFLQIHDSNLVLSALKPSENNPDEFIMRCYEAQGESTEINACNTLYLQDLSESQSVDILETSAKVEHTLQIKPWEVKTYRLAKTY